MSQAYIDLIIGLAVGSLLALLILTTSISIDITRIRVAIEKIAADKEKP